MIAQGNFDIEWSSRQKNIVNVKSKFSINFIEIVNQLIIHILDYDTSCCFYRNLYKQTKASRFTPGIREGNSLVL